MHPTRPLAVLLALLLLLTAHASTHAEPTPAWQAHLAYAETLDDPLALRAARFLERHAPERDDTIDTDLLNANLALALRARAEFPWAGAASEERFLNDVLPYASLDETRERWRPTLYALSKQIVEGADSAEEAAQLLNRHLFNTIDVHYNTRRERSNQSPFESMRQGRATCTGLSIILVNACRSVGIPARVAGVAEWVSTPGNHTWVEIHDGERWRFTGADEYDAKGLDRGWFVGRAAQAVPGSESNAVWASSWRRTDKHFPLAWDRDDRSVPGVDVTRRYAPDAGRQDTPPSTVARFFRVWDREGGDRVVAVIRAHTAEGVRLAPMTTRAGRADLNDMPQASLVPDSRFVLVVTTADSAFRTALDIGTEPTGIVDLFIDEIALAEPKADAEAERLTDERIQAIRVARADEFEDGSITLADHTLRYLVRTFGNDNPEGNPLWISLHGGGGAPPEVNDRQWRNQIRLYEPTEGVYVAPRAPTDTWNLWHRAHIDPLFDRLIENMIATRNVDPGRVYLLGYSAGGDGVYQLAPRTADRYAAASMMAGHPNEAKPLGLRNLPFAIFMGGEDAAYDRNTVAQRWGDRLHTLRTEDPGGYDHRVTIYPGLGHWMNGRDAEALPWMLERTRDPWPRRVVWYQDDVVGTRFYWLAVRPEEAQQGTLITAEAEGQTIRITTRPDRAPTHITLRLSDRLVDLDRPVTVLVNDTVVFRGAALRTAASITSSIDERLDPPSIATAHIEIAVP
ncbi:MAG: transglutaminase domain-containing protein [Planctomycetota bacterium]